jgi:hypothetical protein
MGLNDSVKLSASTTPQIRASSGFAFDMMNVGVGDL